MTEIEEITVDRIIRNGCLGDKSSSAAEIDEEVLAAVPHISRQELVEAWQRVGEGFQAEAGEFRRIAALREESRRDQVLHACGHIFEGLQEIETIVQSAAQGSPLHRDVAVAVDKTGEWVAAIEELFSAADGTSLTRGRDSGEKPA